MNAEGGDMDVWVLAGQSNMQGFGLLGEAAAAPPDPRVQSLSSAGIWEAAIDPLQRLWESYTPVHQALHRTALPAEDQRLSDAELGQREREQSRVGAGLGVAFGTRWADLTGASVGLVPAAHGGTSLEQWERGRDGLDPTSPLSFYGAMLD